MENINISQAILTLGGKGTRLSSITKEIPKLMANRWCSYLRKNNSKSI